MSTEPRKYEIMEDTVKRNRRSTRIYDIWNGMLRRCYNPTHKAYPHYGGRDITVCEAWHDFGSFRNWAICNGYGDNLTIERIDNDGNYSPDNCCFIPQSQQLLNTRRTRFVTIRGEKLAAAVAARKYGINRFTLYERLDSGWNDELAVETPAKTDRERKKPIVQLTVEGYRVRRFDGITDAARLTGICRGGISGCINGKGKTAGGYRWILA